MLRARFVKTFYSLPKVFIDYQCRDTDFIRDKSSVIPKLLTRRVNIFDSSSCASSLNRDKHGRKYKKTNPYCNIAYYRVAFVPMRGARAPGNVTLNTCTPSENIHNYRRIQSVGRPVQDIATWTVRDCIPNGSHVLNAHRTLRGSHDRRKSCGRTRIGARRTTTLSTESDTAHRS